MEEIFEPRPSTSTEDIKLNVEGGTDNEQSTTIGGDKDTAVAPSTTATSDGDSNRCTNTVQVNAAAIGVGPRKLQILPRITQYERHPLLQERSPSGLSQLEELTNLLQRQKSFDLGDGDGMLDECGEAAEESACTSSTASSSQVISGMAIRAEYSQSQDEYCDDSITNKGCEKPRITSEDNNNQVVDERSVKGFNEDVKNHSTVKRLEPRGAFRETHPLLEKSESGLSEVELYLLEKEQELILSNTVTVTPKTHDYNTRIVPPLKRDSAAERRKKLQPRVNQYEKHALLESRDEQGLSPLDHFLHEKERTLDRRLCMDVGAGAIIIDQEEDSTGSKGKCSEKCVCKNATCMICKPNQAQHQSSSGSSTELVLMANTSDNRLAQGATDEVNTTTTTNIPEEDYLTATYDSLVSANEMDQYHSVTEDEVVDIKTPLIYQNTEDDEEVIDLRDPALIAAEDELLAEMVRSHPPLMKKESSRETMIEPKDTNKRVHFERTLSEKEREMRAMITVTDTNSGSFIAKNNPHQDASPALSDKTGVEKGGQKVNNKRRSWLPWGGCTRNPSSHQSAETEVAVTTVSRNSPAEANQRQHNASSEVSPNQTQTLMNEERTNGKDMNENNNKKTRKKACIIL